MKSIIEKNWITFLGIGFIFLAFMYFLKLAIDEGWLPPAARAATGIALGISGLFSGFYFFTKKKILSAQSIAGLGSGIIYATIAYASFSTEISWSPNILGITTILMSTVICTFAYKFNLRVLALMGIIGGLLTPLIIKANPDQDFILFIYLFIINVSALYISALKSWSELRAVTFISTLIIYITYYFHFDPVYWTKPFMYVSILYFVYLFGLILSSWKDENKHDGLNLYLGMINAVNYVFWSIYIFSSFDVPYVIPVLIVGLSFILASSIIFRLNSTAMLASGTYLILGLIVIAISVSDIGLLLETDGLQYAVNAGTWLVIVFSFYIIGRFFSNETFRYAGMAGWFLVAIFWYTVAWEVEWVEWFGIRYIPFINPGALVWIAMAISGFYISKRLLAEEQVKNREGYSSLFAIASLIVIGGLFTVQIQNFWDAYNIISIKIGLTLSFMWFLFALVISMWGAYSKESIYKWLGYAVIAISSIKVLLIDLNGESSIYKIIALLLIGGTSLLIGYVNNKWSENEKEHEQNLA